jgi:hypothetical protein
VFSSRFSILDEILHRVDSSDEESETTNDVGEVADLVSHGRGGAAAVENELELCKMSYVEGTTASLVQGTAFSLAEDIPPSLTEAMISSPAKETSSSLAVGTTSSLTEDITSSLTGQTFSSLGVLEFLFSIRLACVSGYESIQRSLRPRALSEHRRLEWRCVCSTIRWQVISANDIIDLWRASLRGFQGHTRWFAGSTGCNTDATLWVATFATAAQTYLEC